MTARDENGARPQDEDRPVDGDAASFAIPTRPERRYPRSGGVEYEGETRFELTPDPSRSTDDLRDLVESVLGAEPYTYGDWFDLPMPLYTVHDEGSGDVFRVSVRDGQIRMHVLPETTSTGLRRLADRLGEAAPETDWTVTRRVTEA